MLYGQVRPQWRLTTCSALEVEPPQSELTSSHQKGCCLCKASHVEVARQCMGALQSDLTPLFCSEVKDPEVILRLGARHPSEECPYPLQSTIWCSGERQACRTRAYKLCHAEAYPCCTRQSTAVKCIDASRQPLECGDAQHQGAP